LVRQVGAFARLVAFIRFWVASHNINQTLGVHVRFESLDFVVTMEGELV
jgi:hypothetical protein